MDIKLKKFFVEPTGVSGLVEVALKLWSSGDGDACLVPFDLLLINKFLFKKTYLLIGVPWCGGTPVSWSSRPR